MKDKRKTLKFSHTTWLKVMGVKNRYNLKSAEEVIICYQRLVTGLKLKHELEEVIEKFKKK